MKGDKKTYKQGFVCGECGEDKNTTYTYYSQKMKGCDSIEYHTVECGKCNFSVQHSNVKTAIQGFELVANTKTRST